MKIGQPAEQPVGTPAAAEPKVKSTAKKDEATRATTPSSVSAKVQLSEAVSGLLAGIEPTSEIFDAAKVNRLATAIAQGKFVVNPDAVADKLIANARELLDKKSH
jgi:negative regulator of flagellin synthesis FlgM